MKLDEYNDGTAGRFVKCRWSKTRQRIHAMQIGEALRLPPSQYFNAKQSVLRLNDAFWGITGWRITTRKVKRGRISTVTRLEWHELQ